MDTVERLRTECEGDRNLHIYELEKAVKQVEAQRDTLQAELARVSHALRVTIDTLKQHDGCSRYGPSTMLVIDNTQAALQPQVEG